ncbi:MULTISPECIES: hypothetical protein [Paenochrobactrum]|uniref:hypothetical protein n=1 Tax=Paenochrobactrum pullorum TaxID=1324351 RepID=UPI0035BBDD88
MVQRVFLSKSPPRLITSKAGKNATPSLPDADKSFDSNWFDGGGIKWILPRNKSGVFTAFPYQLNYIPYIWGFLSGNYTGDQTYFEWGVIPNSADRPPTNGTRYILDTEFFSGAGADANQNYYATNGGIYNHVQAGRWQGADYFVVFEG